jgi:AraC family transcriptional regulator of adaptative response/methylated-DNA-[protein]-cysteine methyltransferase
MIQYSEKNHNTLYTRLLAKHQSSKYFVGNKSTNLACRFGCITFTPSAQNCIFSERLHTLICYGMKECTDCNPLSYNALQEIQDFLKKIELSESPDKNITPAHKQAQEWMKKFHKTDLLKYICAKRSNGFLTRHSKLLPLMPKILTYQRYITPIGIMLACFSDKGLCLLEFSDRKMLEAELSKLQNKFKAHFSLQSGNLSEKFGVELSEYFRGERQQFSIPLDTSGSSFQLSVWEILKKIPYGSTTSYKKQAVALGRETAVRAVANANGKNCIAILIPCHRVIGQDGSLLGYAGGLERKQYLLDLEHKFLLKNS